MKGYFLLRFRHEATANNYVNVANTSPTMGRPSEILCVVLDNPNGSTLPTSRVMIDADEQINNPHNAMHIFQLLVLFHNISMLTPKRYIKHIANIILAPIVTAPNIREIMVFTTPEYFLYSVH